MDMAVSIHTPSGNINTVSKYKPIRSVAFSIHTPSGHNNFVPTNVNLYAQWLSQHICPVAILIQSLEI